MALTGQVPAQSTPASGSVRLDLSAYLTPSRGTPPYSWSATGLPPGLQIANGSHLVTGTVSPSASQSDAYSVTVTVTDSAGNKASAAAFQWNVTPPPPPTLAPIAPLTTQVGVRASVSTSFTCPAQACSIAADASLPTWISISPLATSKASGTITLTGTPTAADTGTGTAKMTITDTDGGSAQATVTWTVTAVPDKPTITNPGPQTWSSTHPTVSLVSTCPAGGCTFTYTAQLVSGNYWAVYMFGIDAHTGTLTGSSVLGWLGSWECRITVTVTDQNGATASTTFTWAAP